MKLSIPLHNVPALTAQMTLVVRKSERLGLPSPELHLGEIYGITDRTTGHESFWQRVELTGEGIDKPVSYGTHKLLGVFNHEYHRAMYSTFTPDVRPLPEFTQRFAAKNVSHCQHCNKTIRRNNTYVIVDGDGNQMLVGSSCMKSFIPLGKSVEQIFAFYRSIFEDHFNDDMFEDRCADPLQRFTRVTSELLPVVLVRRFTPVVPSDKEGMTALLGYYQAERTKFFNEFGITTDDITAAQETVLEILAWWKELDVPEYREFDYKIQTVVGGDYMRYRDTSVAAWAVHKWFKQFVPEVPKGDNAFSGAVGERLNKIDVVLTGAKHLYHSDFGPVYLYTFTTVAGGNTITWKTTPRDLEEGQRLTLSARVKEHNTFNGINQTLVTRPTLEERP